MFIKKKYNTPVKRRIIVFFVFVLMTICFRAEAALPPSHSGHTTAGNMVSQQPFSGVGMWLLISVLLTFFINWYIYHKENKPD